MFNSYKKIIRVEGMTCEHCANRVKNALCGIDGVKKVKVNLNEGLVNVLTGREIENDVFKNEIEKLGYGFIGE